MNLARLHYAAGRAVQATASAGRALALRDTIEAKVLFVQCVRRTKATSDVGRLRDLILRGLTEPWGRPDELASVALSILMLDEAFRTAVAHAATEWPRHLPAHELSNPALMPALRDPLLHRLLETAPIIDVPVELLLTNMRRALLEAALPATGVERVDEAALAFYCALAQQCFVNEYVFFCGADEARDAQELRARLANALASGGPVSPLWPAAVAAYFPLTSLDAAEALETRAWPACVRALLTQQIGEPRQEKQIRASIPRLTEIDDHVSLEVRGMYEENPYPRWIKVGPTEAPKHLDTYLRNHFPAFPLADVARKATLDILIAGCGTGRQAIEMAWRFVSGKALAIDLSLASLAYAKRKTQEAGLGNVEYGQADILRVGQLGRSFDLIESAACCIISTTLGPDGAPFCRR